MQYQSYIRKGLKLPVRQIAEVVEAANAGRKERDRIMLGVDGVHAFGVEDFTVDDLGCDFLEDIERAVDAVDAVARSPT